MRNTTWGHALEEKLDRVTERGQALGKSQGQKKIGGDFMAKEELFSGESKNVEYKVTVPDKSEKYMKTVVAFANGRGGKIVFGIDDKTLDTVGMDEDNIYKTIDAITNAISDSCEPAIRPDVAMQTVKDKTVIVVEIFPGAERPYYIKSQGMFE